MKKIDPDFEITLIVSANKVGNQEVAQQIKNYQYAKEKYSFVSGFDMVGEEDPLESVYHYKDLILEAQKESNQR